MPTSPEAALHRGELTARLRAAHPAARRLSLAFEELRIDVLTNDDAVHAALARYYGPFVGASGPAVVTVTVHEAPPPQLPVAFTVKQPDPGKRKIKEEYAEIDGGRIVRKRLTGMVFVFGGNDHLAVGPCRDNVNQVVNFINNRHIAWHLARGALLGHAAGVSSQGRGLALAGFSGMGKSTLALHLLSRGATFVSNDRLMVEIDGSGPVMHGVAKLPRINPGTALNNPDLASILPDAERRRYLQLDTAALWEVEDKYDVPIERCFGADRFALRAPMSGLVILNWQRQPAPTEIRQVDPGQRHDLLPAFMKPAGLFYLPDHAATEADRSIAAYAALLKRTTVYEISGGIDFEEACRYCLGILRGEAPRLLK